jgi:hypothetical protein
MKTDESKVGRLRAALRELLAEHQRDGALPTSARFLFYELVQRGIISKERQGSRRADQDMIDALTDIREEGSIPWNWIVDETRDLDDYTGSASIKDWVLEVLPGARLDAWGGEPPLILTESRSLRGVLRNLADQYCAQIAPTNGQCCGFLHNKIVPMLRYFHRILYLGDFDLCGNDIEANTRRVLEHEVGELNWERLALTREQVESYDLPIIIKHDHRFKDGGAHEAVETEALRQQIIIEILRNRLDELLPEPLSTVQERADQQRTRLRAVFEE